MYYPRTLQGRCFLFSAIIKEAPMLKKKSNIAKEQRIQEAIVVCRFFCFVFAAAVCFVLFCFLICIHNIHIYVNAVMSVANILQPAEALKDGSLPFMINIKQSFLSYVNYQTSNLLMART